MRYIGYFIILFLSFLSFPIACGEGYLPEDLAVIDEEAFEGDTALKSIEVPDGTISIGARAFADTTLRYISIPSSVEEIASDSFAGIETPLLIETVPRSAAVYFALQNNLDFRADTVCRALLIGQTDYPRGYELEGPGKDVIRIQGALADYEITVEMNLTAAEIISAVSAAFADAAEEDISLFYYAGHGNEADGSLVGIDLESYVTASDLRTALDTIQGRKIVLIDACFSGALIGESGQSMLLSGISENAPNRDPAALFISNFTRRSRKLSSSLATQQYFVMASSRSDEESWETINGGIFTEAFIKSRASGDANGDHVVSFEESYQYSKKYVQKVVREDGVTQSVQVYPEDCYWFGMFR